VTFKHDPFGRCIQQEGLLGTTNYLYDGDNVLEEIDNAGSVLALYAQGAGVDQPLSQFRAGSASYYGADGLGSTTSLTNVSGTTAGTYVYDSFGNLSASTGSVTNPFRYTSREFDPETGFLFYRARYYDQSVGRFISEDPLTGAGGSKYAYSLNNPINRIDPTGLQTVVIVFWNNPEQTGLFGEHSAVFVSNNGQTVLYDPSGDSRIGLDDHPYDDIFEGASVDDYLGAHGRGTPGTYPEIFVFDTTDKEEAEIAKRIHAMGPAGFTGCARSVSTVLQGIGPFKKLKIVKTPAGLAEQLRELEQPEILRRAIHNMLPKAPEMFPRNP
jgi:RHS repeat-associated protein